MTVAAADPTSDGAVIDLAPYEQLAELAERELELVTAFEPGRVGELVALQQRRTTLVSSLPQTPPRDARPALLRARALQERTTAVLTVLCDQLGRELADLDRGRRAARGYAAAASSRPSLDASA